MAQGARRVARSSKQPRQPVARHRAEVRPRYGRIAVVGAALGVTVIAIGGAMLPNGPDESQAASPATSVASESSQAAQLLSGPPVTEEPAADSVESVTPTGEAAPHDTETALPVASGRGERIVFSQSRQRVWLVGEKGKVLRTYLASGSVTDNLSPGTYEVYSRSEHAVGIDDSGTMDLFVRFTHGTAGAAIGFHTIPVNNGKPVQKVSELGTPLSHGCIRQKREDAVALWDFAPVGTTVVVTA